MARDLLKVVVGVLRVLVVVNQILLDGVMLGFVEEVVRDEVYFDVFDGGA